jgi:hypothetical protein
MSSPAGRGALLASLGRRVLRLLRREDGSPPARARRARDVDDGENGWAPLGADDRIRIEEIARELDKDFRSYAPPSPPPRRSRASRRRARARRRPVWRAAVLGLAATASLALGLQVGGIAPLAVPEPPPREAPPPTDPPAPAAASAATRTEVPLAVADDERVVPATPAPATPTTARVVRAGPPRALPVPAPPASRDEQLLRALIGRWLHASRRDDVTGQMELYAGMVYYAKREMSRQAVEAAKTRRARHDRLVAIEEDPRGVALEIDGRFALATLRRTLVFADGTRQPVEQQLRWARTGAGWKIVAEPDPRPLPKHRPRPG